MNNYWSATLGYGGSLGAASAAPMPFYSAATSYLTGADFVQTDDGIDIAQLEGYLGVACPDDYVHGSAVAGQQQPLQQQQLLQQQQPLQQQQQPQQQSQLRHHYHQQREQAAAAAPSRGCQQLAEAHLSFGSSSSTDRLLAMPESPPYSSGSEPYSPDHLAAAAAAGAGMRPGTSSNHPDGPSPAVPLGHHLLRPLHAMVDTAAAGAGTRQPRALYAPAMQQVSPALPPVQQLPSSSTASGSGSVRSRSSVTPWKKRKTLAAAGGGAHGELTTSELPDAAQLLLQVPPSAHYRPPQLRHLNSLTGEAVAAGTTAGHAFKQEAALVNPNQDSSDATAEDTDEYSYVMDVTLRPIKWQHFDGNKPWCHLLDSAGMPVKLDLYDVDADKGFNFSPIDDSFVCQKKNHFQVTSTIVFSSRPTLFCLPDGSLHPLEGLYYHFYGVKKEAAKQVIRVEQSQSDRSKRPFQPIRVSLLDGKSAKATVGRLHFTETTINNMRKKGKPNPDQRYFLLVSGIYAHSTGADPVQFPIIEVASEKIIVRASNPGQFESDIEIPWHKSGGIESIYHYGTVGINTDKPDEALVINGNMKLMGCVVQPSDVRVKEKIEEVDTREQLSRLAQVRMYRFKFRSDFGAVAGLGDSDLEQHTGVLAQELRGIMPEAVRDGGDVTLANGEFIENLLVVNKDRLFMESVGAVKELCKVTETLESRMHEIEKVNRKLAHLKRIGSMKSAASDESSSAKQLRAAGHSSCATSLKAPGAETSSSSDRNGAGGNIVLSLSRQQVKRPVCTDRAIRMIVIGLIVIMTLCLAAIVALYMLEKPLLTGDNSRPPLPLIQTTAAAEAAANLRSKGSSDSGSYVNAGGNATGCQVLSLAPASVTCCNHSSNISADDTLAACSCQTCKYTSLSNFVEAQWLLPPAIVATSPPHSSSPSASTAAAVPGRRRRDPSRSLSAGSNLFSVVSMTVTLAGSAVPVSITRNMCITCTATCRRGCNNYTVLLLVHASVPQQSTGTLVFRSATDMLVTFQGMAGKYYNTSCNICQGTTTTASSVTLLPPPPAGSGGGPSAGIGVQGSTTPPLVKLLPNTTYATPATFDLPLGEFSRQLYLFRIACVNNDTEACKLMAGGGSVDLYLDVLRSCSVCADSTIRTAQQNFVFVQNVLSGDDRR